MKIICIDDSKLSLLKFREIAGESRLPVECALFHSPASAIEYCSNNHVDLAFVDIEMPEENGIDVASKLNDLKIPVVFLTAYNSFGAQAFSIPALHYLLKPLKLADFEAVLQRYKAVGKAPAAHTEAEEQSRVEFSNAGLPDSIQNIKKIHFRNRNETHIVDLNNILYFMGAGSYTRVLIWGSEQHITSSRNLKYYNEILTGHPDFIRVHRSYLVNRKFVKSLVTENNKMRLLLTNNTSVVLTTKLKNHILKLLSN